MRCDRRNAKQERKTCQPGLYNDPTVIITHSLGGYMLMDAIDDELRNENCSAFENGPSTQPIFIYHPQRKLLEVQYARRVEMPSGLSLPLAFGMKTRLIGSGR